MLRFDGIHQVGRDPWARMEILSTRTFGNMLFGYGQEGAFKLVPDGVDVITILEFVPVGCRYCFLDCRDVSLVCGLRGAVVSVVAF